MSERTVGHGDPCPCRECDTRTISGFSPDDLAAARLLRDACADESARVWAEAWNRRGHCFEESTRWARLRYIVEACGYAGVY